MSMHEDDEALSKARIHKIMHEIVEKQIRDGTPTETKRTLKRLMKAGHSRHGAIHKIAAVIVIDMYNLEKNRENYDEERYVRRLKGLR